MQTVFSHIIQKRFSQMNEDVATDALAFILHSSESARTGMMKLLRGIVADIPDLRSSACRHRGAAGDKNQPQPEADSYVCRFGGKCES